MVLSERTQNFINTHKVKSVVNDRNEIIKIFQNSKLPIFEPVIDFQERFAGIMLHAGLAPIIFGIIPTERSEDPYFTEIDAELIGGKWRFVCADTLYQMGFEIDESGNIFEDDILVAESANNYFASIAFEEEIKSKGFKVGFSIYEPEPGIVQKLVNFFDLIPFEEIIDQGTNWFTGESAFLKVSGNTLYFFAKDNFFKQVYEIGISQNNIAHLNWRWSSRDFKN